MLAALLNLLHLPKVQDASPVPTHTRVKPSSARGRQLLRSVSDKSAKSPLRTPKFGQKTLSPRISQELKKPGVKEPSSEKKICKPSRHLHRRSKSMANIPIITIDYFGSTETLNGRRSAEVVKKVPPIPEVVHEPPKPAPEPQEVLPVSADPPSSDLKSPDSTLPSSTGAECDNNQAAPSFRLFGLKPWGKEKSKRLERCKSSPQLCRSQSLPRSPSHKQSSSDSSVTSPTKDETKPKSRKSLRKIPSVPAQGKESEFNHFGAGIRLADQCLEVGIKFDVTFRHAEKKRSQTLRTQPYDAPYFALPPVPPLPPAYRKTAQEETSANRPSHPESNTDKLLDRKSSKSRI